MKKIICLLITFVLVLSVLCSCNNSSEDKKIEPYLIVNGKEYTSQEAANMSSSMKDSLFAEGAEIEGVAHYSSDSNLDKYGFYEVSSDDKRDRKMVALETYYMCLYFEDSEKVDVKIMLTESDNIQTVSTTYIGGDLVYFKGTIHSYYNQRGDGSYQHPYWQLKECRDTSLIDYHNCPINHNTYTTEFENRTR